MVHNELVLFLRHRHHSTALSWADLLGHLLHFSFFACFADGSYILDIFLVNHGILPVVHRYPLVAVQSLFFEALGRCLFNLFVS